MLKLVIIDKSSGRDRNSEVLFNPDYIMFVRDGGVDIFGRSYVKVFPHPQAATFLPCDKHGWVAVKGDYDEITKMIVKAKGGMTYSDELREKPKRWDEVQ